MLGDIWKTAFFRFLFIPQTVGSAADGGERTLPHHQKRLSSTPLQGATDAVCV